MQREICHMKYVDIHKTKYATRNMQHEMCLQRPVCSREIARHQYSDFIITLACVFENEFARVWIHPLAAAMQLKNTCLFCERAL